MPYNLPTATIPPQPSIDFFCERVANSTTGDITVSMKWTIIPSNQSDSEELQHILNAIETYRVTNWIRFRTSDDRFVPWRPFRPRVFNSEV